MYHRITDKSKLLLSENDIRLSIYSSRISKGISCLILLGCMSLIILCVLSPETIKNQSVYIMLLAVIYPIYSFGYKETFLIDLKKHNMIRKKMIFIYCFKTSSVTWSEGHFSYIVKFDDYDRISKIWLVVRDSSKNKARKLIKFEKENSFLKFQKLFNEKFPDNKIMEWHS